jgi:hypothetical protein
VIVTYSRHYAGVCLRGVRKTMKILIQDSQRACRNSNIAPPPNTILERYHHANAFGILLYDIICFPFFINFNYSLFKSFRRALKPTFVDQEEYLCLFCKYEYILTP